VCGLVVLRRHVGDYSRGGKDLRGSSHVRACVERPRVHGATRAIVQSHRRAEEGEQWALDRKPTILEPFRDAYHERRGEPANAYTTLSVAQSRLVPRGSYRGAGFVKSYIAQKPAHLQPFADGETRTRTGDTTIFSRVLYQLSYLAGRLMLADAELRHQRGVGPAQPLGDRDLGPPAELTLGAGDVQAAVL
jgi:hypothetical protein